MTLTGVSMAASWLLHARAARIDSLMKPHLLLVFSTNQPTDPLESLAWHCIVWHLSPHRGGGGGGSGSSALASLVEECSLLLSLGREELPHLSKRVPVVAGMHEALADPTGHLGTDLGASVALVE